MMMRSTALCAFALTTVTLSQLTNHVTGFTFPRPHHDQAFRSRPALKFASSPESASSVEQEQQRCVAVDRRTAAIKSLAGAFGIVALGAGGEASAPRAAWAASEMPAEFKNVGQQAPAPTGETPFRTLPDGVQVKDFRQGSGDVVVGDGSKVAVQLTGRLLNLNGVIFYDTKNNDPDGFGGLPLSFTIGDGQVIPGLESGLRGMRKGGIRRIIVPPELGYGKFPGREPNPADGSAEQRALNSVIKNPRRDATLLFDAKLERVK